MLATISVPPSSSGSTHSHTNNSISQSVQRRTSFLIRDILGYRDDEINSDSDADKDVSCDINTRCDKHEDIPENNLLESRRGIAKGWIASEVKQKYNLTRFSQESKISTHSSILCCRECEKRENNEANNDESERRNSHQITQEGAKETEQAPTCKIITNKTNYKGGWVEKTNNSMETLNPTMIKDKTTSDLENSGFYLSPVPSDRVNRNNLLYSDDENRHDDDRISSNNLNKSLPDGIGSSLKRNDTIPLTNQRFFCDENLKKLDIFERYRESSRYAPYNEHFINPSAAIMDFSYAYNVRAASVGVPHLPLQLIGYRSPDPSEVKANSYLGSSKFSFNRGCSGFHRHEPYPRYRIVEWPQDSPCNLVHNASSLLKSYRHEPTSATMNDDAPVSESSSPKEECCSSSTQPSSPTSSEQSSSPSPHKRAIQLPAYLRSRLGGNSSNAEGTNGEGGKTKKCRRSRTVFSELQMLGLEKRFEKQQYLSTPDRVELAELLGLTQLQVKTWYQNRRMKWKKQVLQGGGTEPPTKPKGRPRKVRPDEVGKPVTANKLTDLNKA